MYTLIRKIRLVTFSFLVTFSAENWLSFSRLEWYFAFLLTFRTGCFMHFAWAKVVVSLESAAVAVKSVHCLFPPIWHIFNLICAGQQKMLFLYKLSSLNTFQS